MTVAFPRGPLREALGDLKQKTADIGSSPPGWERVLTIREHEGALDPSRPIVVGDRGTGKSFWTGVLTDTQNRNRAANVYGRLELGKLDVALGFGGDEFSSEHPSAHELAGLLREGHSAELIWRAVILSLLPPEIRPTLPSSWSEKVRWVASEPSLRRSEFQAADRFFLSRGRRFLVIFDALDTLASKWDEIATLMKGLLQVGLFLRPSRALKIKLFLRPDMADDPSLWAVGDSSKLRHDEVILAWTRRDLHALLLQHLANDERTSDVIDGYCRRVYRAGLSQVAGRLAVPEPLIQSEPDQQQFFVRVAGEYMGRSATKGRTYTWVPNHLANARGYAAPRSFLLALAVAAEASRGEGFALEVQGIQEGVRQASQSRMRELREDYRWIDVVFRPLRGMSVPVEPLEFFGRWANEKVIWAIYTEMDSDKTGRYLPPPRIVAKTDDQSTRAALLETLNHLGIVEEIGDGRLNMPDLFRLAAGVKRRGGVKLRP